MRGRERSVTISSAVWIQCTKVTDGRTNRQTPGDRKDRAYVQRRAVRSFQLQGAKTPDPQGLCPWTPLATPPL